MTTRTPKRPVPDNITDYIPHHPDTGCPDLAIPACLRCPLPACRYDGEEDGRITENARRHEAAVVRRAARKGE
jgi:hypothetical protein